MNHFWAFGKAPFIIHSPKLKERVRMRIKLTLEPEDGKLTLPIHYNHIVQSMIYSSLDEALAEWLHEQGFVYKKRRFKLFTFSKLFGKKVKFDPKNGSITFFGPINLNIASVEVELLESLAVHLIRSKGAKLGGKFCIFSAVEVEFPVEYKRPMLVKTLSPITVYRTVEMNGRKKTYYFAPKEPEFNELILDNLRRKAIAFYGEDTPLPSLEGAYVIPVRIFKRVITQFKGTVIIGWHGLFEMDLPKEFFSLAYDSGLGSKNSQGFGMVEAIKGKSVRKKQHEDGNKVL